MSAVIKELQRKRKVELHELQVKQANIRTGMLALVDAFEAAKAAIDAGELGRGRSDFVTARAGALKLIREMYATPARHMLTAFVEISHVWTNYSSATDLERAAAGGTLAILGKQIRARFA